jgi:hypothetical protein
MIYQIPFGRENNMLLIFVMMIVLMKSKFLIKQLQRFLESLNYVTDWYPNVSKIAKPLHDRLRKNHVSWSDEHIRIARQI